MPMYALQSSTPSQSQATEATSEATVAQPYGNLAAAEYLFGGGEQGPSSQTPTGEGDGYRSQRDNETFMGVSGDSQCLLTSTTMVVLAALGDTFVDIACVKLAEVGLPCRRADIEGKEPEMVIQEWAAARDWSAEEPGRDFNEIRFLQVCAEVTIEEWIGAQLVATGRGGDLRSRLEGIDPLPAVISTNLTGSGHVVTLRSVDGSGVVVHDPNGAFLEHDYLANGSAPSQSGPPAHRWAEAPFLREAYEAGEARDDWGRDNRFTWDEVEAHDIGKWSLTGG